eukprot:320356-Amphidinium_carterae.1
MYKKWSTTRWDYKFLLNYGSKAKATQQYKCYIKELFTTTTSTTWSTYGLEEHMLAASQRRQSKCESDEQTVRRQSQEREATMGTTTNIFLHYGNHYKHFWTIRRERRMAITSRLRQARRDTAQALR